MLFLYKKILQNWIKINDNNIKYNILLQLHFLDWGASPLDTLRYIDQIIDNFVSNMKMHVGKTSFKNSIALEV